MKLNNIGTGHGYGCCLNVHEGPTLISSRSNKIGTYYETPLLPGFTVTNGLYIIVIVCSLYIFWKEKDVKMKVFFFNNTLS